MIVTRQNLINILYWFGLTDKELQSWRLLLLSNSLKEVTWKIDMESLLEFSGQARKIAYNDIDLLQKYFKQNYNNIKHKYFDFLTDKEFATAIDNLDRSILMEPDLILDCITEICNEDIIAYIDILKYSFDDQSNLVLPHIQGYGNNYTKAKFDKFGLGLNNSSIGLFIRKDNDKFNITFGYNPDVLCTMNSNKDYRVVIWESQEYLFKPIKNALNIIMNKEWAKKNNFGAECDIDVTKFNQS